MPQQPVAAPLAEVAPPAEVAAIPPASPPAEPIAPLSASPAQAAGSLSGQSIASILSAPKRTEQVAGEETAPKEAAADPEAEKKITHFATKFVHTLQAERPRIANVFIDMKVSGNRVTVPAHSQELHDEIVRNQTEILGMLAAVAGVTGPIALEVKIVESQGAKKPIKVEDRLRFLTEINPLVTTLRKELDLDLE